jgi:hypothetical protein
MTRRATLALLLLAAQTGCGAGAPGPSHVSTFYRGKLEDDTLVEASTTAMVTTRDVVIALNCKPLEPAIKAGDTAAIDAAVTRGVAARLPAGVTLYTPPFSPANPRTAPFVVTDDKYGGTLCTPDSYRILRS